jgi:alpha-beta hydrolase superfamily lysophospholipase
MKILGFALLAIVAFVALLFLFGPREPVDREITFNPASLPGDLDAWLAESEAGVNALRSAAAKRIVWAGAAGAVTPLAVVYVHGFSASAEEIRPVPDRVAEALGANLFYTRLSGHGRDGAAMAEPLAGDWIEDVAEAIAIGRRIGERVILVGTSTGGTLVALAATDPVLSEDLAGVAMLSPNFRVLNPSARLLALPFARHWAPRIAGETREFEPRNAEHGQHWTTRYPMVATVPLVALSQHSVSQDYASTPVPALFLYSDHDSVVDASVTAEVFDAWGGPKTRLLLVMGEGDDPGSHVVAGDILSPGQNETVTSAIVDWAKSLPEE